MSAKLAFAGPLALEMEPDISHLVPCAGLRRKLELKLLHPFDGRRKHGLPLFGRW